MVISVNRLSTFFSLYFKYLNTRLVNDDLETVFIPPLLSLPFPWLYFIFKLSCSVFLVWSGFEIFQLLLLIWFIKSFVFKIAIWFFSQDLCLWCISCTYLLICLNSVFSFISLSIPLVILLNLFLAFHQSCYLWDLLLKHTCVLDACVAFAFRLYCVPTLILAHLVVTFSVTFKQCLSWSKTAAWRCHFSFGSSSMPWCIFHPFSPVTALWILVAVQWAGLGFLKVLGLCPLWLKS